MFDTRLRKERKYPDKFTRVLFFLQLLTPNPMVVATKLLARKQFIDTGKQLNLIAQSWIQFMIHEWIDHLESSQEVCIH